MNFTYTDLSKVQNYIGFESGVFCVYPNYDGINLLEPSDVACGAEDSAVRKKFMELFPNEAIP